MMNKDDYDIDCAVDTLIKAEEIKSDPKLMAKVLERTKEKQLALKSIAGLKKRAQEVLSKDEKESEYGDDPELRTDDDKAALQEEKVVDDKLSEMGFKKKK